jgi:hypothetical protein
MMGMDNARNRVKWVQSQCLKKRSRETHGSVMRKMGRRWEEDVMLEDYGQEREDCNALKVGKPFLPDP